MRIGTEASDHSASTSDSSPLGRQPPLEKLPVELQTLILSSTPDLRSLRSLVHSSPILHRVYRGSRLRILQSILGNILGGMVIEALATPHCDTTLFEEASEAFFGWPFNKEDEARYNMPESYWLCRLDLSDIIHLLTSHARVMDPLTEQFVNWALTSLNVSSVEEKIWRQSLRTMERRRVQRAMYRLQVMNDVCCYDGRHRERLFSMFPPWEIEQVLCINDFAREVKSDVLVNSVMIDGLAHFMTQERRREWFYSKYDLAQDFKHKMKFEGDEINSPPLAWVLLWGEEHCSLYGDNISGELRRFGYVMWDAARLGERAQARIDYVSYGLLGGGYEQDARWEYYDSSVKVERPEDWWRTTN